MTGTNTSFGNATYDPGVPEELLMTLKIFLALVSVFGTCGNILTIVSIAKTRKLHTAPNAYVANLAITDLTVCAVLIPMAIVFYDGPPNELLCQMVGYPNLVCMVVSVFNLSLIAANRYVLICKSRALYMKIYRRRNIIISCFMAWFITGMCLLPPFFGLGRYGYNIKFGTCIFITNDPETYWMIFFFGDCTIIFPTLFITLFCYVKIMLAFHQSQMMMEKGNYSTSINQERNTLSSNSAQYIDDEEFNIPTLNDKLNSNVDVVEMRPVSTYDNDNDNDYDNDKSDEINNRDDCREQEHRSIYLSPDMVSDKGSSTTSCLLESSDFRFAVKDMKPTSLRHALLKNKKGEIRRKRKTVVRTLFIIWVTFLCFWMPLILFYKIDYHSALPNSIYHILYALAMSNSAVNFIIYAMTNINFRKAYVHVLTFGRK